VFKRVEINQLMAGLLDLMAPVLSRKGVAVFTAFDPDIPSVVGDPGQLQQVFLNLVANALDAMPDGGSLRIMTRRASGDESLSDGGQLDSRAVDGDTGFVELCVADTGKGIPPQYVDRVFEPFFTTKDIGKGTGLGLAICRRLVEAHGGMIQVASRVGVGTSFSVVLPIARG
jgi:signal transduction histidine kinase